VSDAAAQLSRADVMLGAGRYAEAITLVAAVLAAEPDNSRGWSLLAQAQIGAGQPAEGLAAAERAVQLDPASAWAHRLRSIAQRRTGQARQALETAGEACRLDPHHWMNHLNLAQAALAAASGRAGDSAGLQVAQQAGATARQLAPNEPSVHYVSGQISRALGEPAAARAHFERTLALDPEHSNAVNELGRLTLEFGKPGDAARHFVQAARIAPGQSVYGHNVEVAVVRAERSVRSLVRWVIYGSWLVVIAALAVSQRSMAERIVMLAVLGVAAAGVAVGWQIQLRKMPKEARPLFQGRSMLLALGVSLISLLVGVAVVEFMPGRLGNYLLPVVIVMLVARFAAFKILRDGARKRYDQITQRSQVVKA
jgi:tetratricopeptide (TPR) repeat protein